MAETSEGLNGVAGGRISVAAPIADDFESEYRKIGWWDGPHGSPEAHRQIRDFWVRAGSAGAHWLAQRLRQETHSDVLDFAGSLLADVGPDAVGPILVELNQKPTWGQTKALLNALGWLPLSPLSSVVGQLTEVVKTHLRSEHAELREAACRAATLLPNEQAIQLLQAALRDETDAEVRTTLEDELSTRSTR